MNDNLAEPVAVVPEGARRRYLTIVFSDLSDSTRLGASMEAEHYAAMLGDLRRAFSTVLSRHGGTVVRIQGDGVLAIFGYPDTREDDVRRAAEAVLELHATVRQMRPRSGPYAHRALTLHSGIHAGLVLLDAGDVVRGRFELLGNAPNIAARLSDEAGSDEILVSEETLGPECGYFEVSARQFITMKGRTEPLAACRVLGRAGATTRDQARRRRGLLPFVGRGEALDWLAQGWSQARDGHYACRAVVAPAGVGKTRLVEEFLDRSGNPAAPERRVLRGYCEPLLSAEPFQPFLQMVRDVFGVQHGQSPQQTLASLDVALQDLGPALQAHRPVFLRALALSGPWQEAGRPALRVSAEQWVAALRALFETLAARGVLLVWIDDWQWADEATRQMVAVLRALGARPILVLLTTRELAPDEADRLGAQCLGLPPFSEDESEQTVRHLLPSTDPFQVTAIRHYSGGNALFIEELCHSLAHLEAGRLPCGGRQHAGPAWLDVLIGSRLARLPVPQIELLRAAAVIGNVVPSWLLEAVTGCAEDHPMVQALAEQDFIFPGVQAGLLRFKHGITRDVIYGAVGLQERQALHLRIAQAIQQHDLAGAHDESIEALAYHYGAAGQVALAARYAELAGDKAMASSALDRAKAQYRAALAALDQAEPSHESLQHWLRLTHRLGLACVFDASREDLPIFRRAVDLAMLAGEPAMLARALYWLSYVLYALGEARESIRQGEQALALARELGDGPLEVQVLATLGQVRASSADYDLALSLLGDASAIKRHHRSGGRPAVGLAYTLACLAAVHGDRGEFAQASDCFDEALDVVHEVLHEVGASIRGWRAAVLLWQGCWAEAQRTAAEAYRIGEQVRSLFSFSMSRAAGSYAEWMQTGAGAALQGVDDATAWLARREGGLFVSLNHGWLADGHAAQGHVEATRRHAAQALQRGRRRDLLGGAMAARALARLAAEAGDRARAERCLARAAAVARLRGSAHELATTQWWQARIAWRFEDRAMARAALEPALQGFAAMDMRWHLAEAECLLAQIG
jgi:class 3 adenylate cyclase/tetratricopeptide (TPR) repeat protein